MSTMNDNFQGISYILIKVCEFSFFCPTDILYIVIKRTNLIKMTENKGATSFYKHQQEISKAYFRLEVISKDIERHRRRSVKRVISICI